MSQAHRIPQFEIVEALGFSVRAAVWRAPSGPTKPPPLLFFNGVGANIELMAPLANWFPERDIVTFDMPGVGGSPLPPIPYRPWMMARVAKRVLKHFGFDGAVDVMGVSWGGGLAQQFAWQYPARVRKLILAATSPGALMVPGRFTSLSRMANPRRYFDTNYMRENFEALYGEEGGGADGHMARISPPSRLGYFYQLTAMIGWTSAPFLPFVRKPALVLMGDKDSLVPLINGRILAGLLPNARLEIVEGGGHLFLVTRAEESARRIHAFLDEPATETRRAA